MPRYVLVNKWVWLVGMAVALVSVSAVVPVVILPHPLTWTLLVITIAQAGLALPAAWALPQRKRWARMVLMVLAALSIGSLYNALQSQAWASLILNVLLGSTLGLLQDRTVREFFGLRREPWLYRRVRGSSD